MIIDYTYPLEVYCHHTSKWVAPLGGMTHASWQTCLTPHELCMCQSVWPCSRAWCDWNIPGHGTPNIYISMYIYPFPSCLPGPCCLIMQDLWHLVETSAGAGWAGFQITQLSINLCSTTMAPCSCNILCIAASIDSIHCCLVDRGSWIWSPLGGTLNQCWFGLVGLVQVHKFAWCFC